MNTNVDKVLELLRRAGFSFEEGRKLVAELMEIGYFDAPASSKHHLAYPGGLAEHSINVCETLCVLTQNTDIEWQHIRSPIIVGLLHDLCKVDAYEKTEDGYRYDKHCLLNGHGDKSVIIAQQILPLTGEEVCCIRYHMGAYYEQDWNGYDASIREFPPVLWTHLADMIASKLIEK